MRTIAIAIAALAAMSCDPNAKASSKTGDDIPSAKQSKEYESCAATVHCKTGLRCVEEICVGDYYAAAGNRALANDKPDEAVRHYASALSAYSTAKLTPPVSLYCEQGRALAAAREDKKNAELAAKVLHHRCLQNIPINSRYRKMALTALAALGEVGLDPGLLARADAADRYLTKAPMQPEMGEFTVKVTSSVTSRARSFTALMDGVKVPTVTAAMRPCFDAYFKATKKTKVALSYPFRSRYVRGEFEEDDGYRLKLEKASPPSDPAAAVAHACVQKVLEPVVKSVARKGGSWKGMLTFTLGG
jgi:hypothetical protein